MFFNGSQKDYRVISQTEIDKRLKAFTKKASTLAPPSGNMLAAYESLCESYCDAQGIAEIAAKTLANCFRMPPFGIQVQIPGYGYKLIYFPACTGEFSERTKNRLGSYSADNGIVCFVYRDGHTYVTKGLGILDELIAAGYHEDDSMHVPFSSGEKIISPGYNREWNAIKTIRIRGNH